MYFNLSQKNIAVIGSSGQVGSSLAELLSQNNIDHQILDRDFIDLSDPLKIKQSLSPLAQKPDVIINAAAYTAVDAAEDDQDLCYKVNCEAVKEIAQFCKDNDVIFVNYSTDYVYDGEGDVPFKECDKSRYQPQNFYGKSKLDADLAVSEINPKHLNFRTSWVYNHSGKNFFLTMLNLFSQKKELKIIYDQVGSPTYAFDIAEYSLLALDKSLGFDSFPSGVYHLINEGYYSWYQFANLILQKAQEADLGDEFLIENIYPIETSEYPTRAKRPLNSRLSQEKFQKTFGLNMPEVEKSLSLCFSKI